MKQIPRSMNGVRVGVSKKSSQHKKPQDGEPTGKESKMIRPDRKDHKIEITVGDSGFKVVVSRGTYSSDEEETHYASNHLSVATIVGKYFQADDNDATETSGADRD